MDNVDGIIQPMVLKVETQTQSLFQSATNSQQNSRIYKSPLDSFRYVKFTSTIERLKVTFSIKPIAYRDDLCLPHDFSYGSVNLFGSGRFYLEDSNKIKEISYCIGMEHIVN